MDDPIFEAFQRQVWRLERIAAKQGGYLKITATNPKVVAHGARLYRAVSRMSFVDLPDAVPRVGEVCAFSVPQWQRMPLWDVHSTLVKCRGRLALTVVTGQSREEAQQMLVTGATEVARLCA